MLGLKSCSGALNGLRTHGNYGMTTQVRTPAGLHVTQYGSSDQISDCQEDLSSSIISFHDFFPKHWPHLSSYPLKPLNSQASMSETFSKNMVFIMGVTRRPTAHIKYTFCAQTCFVPKIF